jgi:PIN domain nuclease of toxin-antitoxin system
MKLLLDTHVALWAITDDPKLSGLARTLIEDPENEIFVSVASAWEIAIKHAIGRAPNPMPMSGGEALDAFGAAGYQIIGITPAHVVALDALPPLHRDPFDRILVAQAISTPLRMLTRDRIIPTYSDTIIVV